MNYSKAEQETTVVWDEEQKVARIYTASPITLRKLNKLCEACPDEYRQTWMETDKNGRVTAAKYEVAAKYIKFAKPASEARKEAGRRIAAAMLKKRNS
jgi:hypothetical protein